MCTLFSINQLNIKIFIGTIFHLSFNRKNVLHYFGPQYVLVSCGSFEEIGNANILFEYVLFQFIFSPFINMNSF
jgi:hypothetical protein